jgi:Tfp pilus assembly protein PilO
MRRRLELGLSVVGIIVLAAVLWLVLVRPQSNKASAAGQREDIAAANAERLQGEIAERKELEKQAPSFTSRRDALQRLFPKTNNEPELTDGLQAIADQSGVALNAVQVAAPAAGAGQKLASISVSLDLEGTFFQLEDFINRVENFAPANLAETTETSRAALIDTVDMTVAQSADASGTAATTSGVQLLAAKLTVIVFQSIEETTPAAATAPAPAATPSPTPSPSPRPTPTPTPTTGATG